MLRWLCSHGCSIEQPTFVPPNPLQLPDYLQACETFLDSNDIDFLLQTALVHAQFELLHPFKDGNGRIGRILTPLFLYQKRALSQPMFCLSEYPDRWYKSCRSWMFYGSHRPYGTY